MAAPDEERIWSLCDNWMKKEKNSRVPRDCGVFLWAPIPSRATQVYVDIILKSRLIESLERSIWLGEGPFLGEGVMESG